MMGLRDRGYSFSNRWVRRAGFLLVLGASAGLLYGAWTQTISTPVVTSIATVILVLVTYIYVHLTWGHLDAARRQADATEASYIPDINTDYYLSQEGIQVLIINRGQGVAKDITYRMAIDTDELVYLYQVPIETSLQSSRYIDLTIEPTFYIDSKDLSGQSVEEVLTNPEMWDVDKDSDTMLRRGLISDLMSKLKENGSENPDLYAIVRCCDISGGNEQVENIIDDAYIDLADSSFADAVRKYSGGGTTGDEYWKRVEQKNTVVFNDDIETPIPKDESDL